MGNFKLAHRKTPDAKRAEMEAVAAKKLAPSIPRKNVLRYSIVRQLISGVLGDHTYGPFKAPSGSGQDGISIKAVDYSSWNPAKQTDKEKKQRGGVIVPGWWIVVPEKIARGKHSSQTAWGAAPTQNSLRVLPYLLAEGYADSIRNSFYIHGIGGHGSDGCILLPANHRQVLADLVCANGGAWLHAYLSGVELNEVVERNDRFSSTA